MTAAQAKRSPLSVPYLEALYSSKDCRRGFRKLTTKFEIRAVNLELVFRKYFSLYLSVQSAIRISFPASLLSVLQLDADPDGDSDV